MALAIIVCRGLLSNVVMFDTQGPDGQLALVICSGHGPMFPATSTGDMASGSVASDTMDGTDMPGMNMAAAPSPDTSASTSSPDAHLDRDDHGTMDMRAPTADDNTICPFSAVLFAAAFAFLVVLLCCVAALSRTGFRPSRDRDFATRTPYRLALTRAPPSCSAY